jgi:hypothetical protein
LFAGDAVAAGLRPPGQTVSSAQVSGPANVVIVLGQSNMASHGTAPGVWRGGVPGAIGVMSATATCSETNSPLPGATPASGTLECWDVSSGTLYAGQLVTGDGVPAGQTISAANNRGHFPAASGVGGAGTYVVTPAPDTSITTESMTFAPGDIGGGALNNSCQIWVAKSLTSGAWMTYNPNIGGGTYNSDPTTPRNRSKAWGPEIEFCRRWTADNAGAPLFIIKLAVGGSHLCMQPSSNQISPETTVPVGNIASVFPTLNTMTAAAEAALTTQFGFASYNIIAYLYGQGEQDNKDTCGYPAAPFAATVTPNIYQVNLLDLIGRLAIPTTVSASFSGYISPDFTLHVVSVASGTLSQYQLVAGAGVLADTFITGQLSGTPGGVGAYALQVYQATNKEIITASSGASCDAGYVNGWVFVADPDRYARSRITKSCVTGGIFAVGNTISGLGLQPNTTITALDSEGDTADGWYNINVPQTLGSSDSPASMTASVPGWGAGADTARFVDFQTAGSYAGGTNGSGVQPAKNALNDSGGAALTVVTVPVNDRLPATTTGIHYWAPWIQELGRRLYLGYLGQCDYHMPTC